MKKRIISALLALIMMGTLALSASAATAADTDGDLVNEVILPTTENPDMAKAEATAENAHPENQADSDVPAPANPTPREPDSPIISTPRLTDTIGILEVVQMPEDENYLQWATMVMSNPRIAYDGGMDMYYLDFGLSDASKLAALYRKYEYAFRVFAYLEELTKLNDANTAIWEKPEWRKKSIGAQLSKNTTTALKALDDYDAYDALTLIKTRPEYRNNTNLQDQVNYHLAMMYATMDDLMKGLDQLKPNDAEWSISDKTPMDAIELAENFLSQRAELEVLDEVYKVTKSGQTGNALATFLMADADKISELYANVADTAKGYWKYDIDLLEDTRFAIPLSGELFSDWPSGETKPVAGNPPLENPNDPSSSEQPSTTANS